MDGDKYFEVLKSKSPNSSFKGLRDFHKNIGLSLGQEKPFYAIDLADILWKAQLWRENLHKIDPFYAVKANADPLLVRLFVLLGYGFDCSTEGEIRHVLEGGADPKRIIFAHTIKTQGALRYAASVGVDLMTFDSAEELLKISGIYPTARLILRLKAESSQTVYNLSKKFGADTRQAEKLLLKAKDLGLNVVGVSFHVGALCEDPSTYTSTIQKCRTVFDIANRLGFNFTIVNIGAGFFGSKKREPFFYTLAEQIRSSLEENFPEDGAVLMAEPGCYCVCSAVTLTTTVFGKKSREYDGEGILKEYYLNDGFYGSFFDHNDIYDVQGIPILISEEKEKPGRKMENCKLWGLTCCSEDLIRESVLLPDMNEGDLIVWENMGAYSRGVFSNFTCVPWPETYYIFVKNPRLKFDAIPNSEEIFEFIIKNATFVDEDDLQVFQKL